MIVAYLDVMIIYNIPLSKKELLIALSVFLLVFSSVIMSRAVRLNSSSSLVFTEPYELILTERTELNDLVEMLSTDLNNFEEDEFIWAARLLGWNQYQAGRYFFDSTSSYESFVSKIGRGIQDPVDIVVTPGINVESFSKIISRQTKLDSAEIISQFTDSVSLSRYGMNKEVLFGRMLPETYKMYWNSSAEQVIERLLDAFEKNVIEPEKDRIDSLGYSIDEILALASIVEWEANLDEEKNRISGLYWNRLERGMLLQADPTVNYAIGERRRVLFEDYQLDHPFNTYVNKGLPPGPITNPSLTTIKAALYPEDHNFLYMVASPEGGHTFTSTFEEHRIESEKWRKWLREQYRIRRRKEAENSN
ncbi:endolytic transglycosylase MltG [Balneola sp. MJW-20]|uniref:endolytic transglycosylase MltG n=1 Tax=Gracilimonas aurantiaca TaxID=3234185 RepID=UPI00390AE03A